MEVPDLTVRLQVVEFCPKESERGTPSRRALPFGNNKINASSAAKSVAMTNTNPKAAAIASITLKNTAFTQVAGANNCDIALPGYASCTIMVTFKPTTNSV